MGIDDVSKASYRVPQGLNEANQTLFGRSLKDIILTLGISIFPAIVILAYVPLPMPVYVEVPILIAGFGAAVGIFWSVPIDMTVSEWIGAVVGYTFRDPHLTHLIGLADTGRVEQRDAEETEETRVWEVSGTRTQELTPLERIHVDDHVMERHDGSYVAALRVSGVNMAMESGESRSATVDEFAGFLNDNEFPMQIYVTTEQYGFEEHANQYEERIYDSDIRKRPILEQLLADYTNTALRQATTQGIRTRQYYVIIPVSPDDVESMRSETSVSDNLAELPVLNRFMQGDQTTEAEKHRERLDEADRRVRYIGGGIGGITGLSATRVSAGELALLGSEFWSGASHSNLKKSNMGDSDRPQVRQRSVLDRDPETN